MKDFVYRSLAQLKGSIFLKWIFLVQVKRISAVSSWWDGCDRADDDFLQCYKIIAGFLKSVFTYFLSTDMIHKGREKTPTKTT